MIERKEYDGITLLTVTNAGGASVTLSTLGAGIVSVIVPDAQGRMADVVLGYADPADYMADGPCAGKTPGRFANRIGNARFILDGKEYRLSRNDGENSLHGGPGGFHNRIWECVSAGGDSVEMRYVSADGEEGYPGKLTVSVRYTWTDSCELRVAFHAVTNSPTVVNLTNHAYFNLAGHDAGSVLGHRMQIFASRYVPTDRAFIPTGEISGVAGTPMDFLEPRIIGDGINPDGSVLLSPKGYNHCWVLDAPESDGLRMAARLSDPGSGRTLEVATTQPGVQVYTGGWLAGAPRSKSGTLYDDYAGVALECQSFPDAPNHPAFPSTRLNPGESYDRLIVFRFMAEPPVSGI